MHAPPRRRAADATVIGDSENDVLSARAAGCRVIVVETGYNEGKSTSDLDADAIVPTLLHAARLIEPRHSETDYRWHFLTRSAGTFPGLRPGSLALA